MNNFWHNLKKPIMALAPMAGYTDSAFRLICREMGADVVYSEMTSVNAICHHSQKTLEMLKFDTKECPLVFQLFGSNPENFAKALKIIQSSKSLITNHQLPLGIDINFGCPAPKVYKTGAGAALMNELNLAYEIIQAVCENTQLLVSIKIRTQVKDADALQFVQKVKSLPFTAIMIHGRSLGQGFTGPINYNIIKMVKQELSDKIVLANGGINTHQDIKNTLKKTNADGVGIARGALGNPWIFKKDPKLGYLNSGFSSNWPECKKVILKHAKLFLKDNSNLVPLRKHLVHYFKGTKNASTVRQQIIKIETLDDLKKIINYNN